MGRPSLSTRRQGRPLMTPPRVIPFAPDSGSSPKSGPRILIAFANVRRPIEAETSAGHGTNPHHTTVAVDSAPFDPKPEPAPESG
jgi:hypothetical protein